MREFLTNLCTIIQKYEDGDIDGYELGDWLYNHRRYIRSLKEVLYDEADQGNPV